jgi:hypothetical protein
MAKLRPTLSPCVSGPRGWSREQSREHRGSGPAGHGKADPRPGAPRTWEAPSDRSEGLILQLGVYAPRPLLTVDDTCEPRLRARRGPRSEEDEGGSHLAATVTARGDDSVETDLLPVQREREQLGCCRQMEVGRTAGGTVLSRFWERLKDLLPRPRSPPAVDSSARTWNIGEDRFQRKAGFHGRGFGDHPQELQDRTVENIHSDQ